MACDLQGLGVALTGAASMYAAISSHQAKRAARKAKDQIEQTVVPGIEKLNGGGK